MCRHCGVAWEHGNVRCRRTGCTASCAVCWLDREQHQAGEDACEDCDAAYGIWVILCKHLPYADVARRWQGPSACKRSAEVEKSASK